MHTRHSLRVLYWQSHISPAKGELTFWNNLHYHSISFMITFMLTCIYPCRSFLNRTGNKSKSWKKSTRFFLNVSQKLEKMLLRKSSRIRIKITKSLDELIERPFIECVLLSFYFARSGNLKSQLI